MSRIDEALARARSSRPEDLVPADSGPLTELETNFPEPGESLP